MAFDGAQQIFFIELLEAVQPGKRTDHAAACRIAAVEPDLVENDPLPRQFQPQRMVARDQLRRETVRKGEIGLRDMMETGDGAAVFPKDLADREAGQQSAEQIFEQVFECVGVGTVATFPQLFFQRRGGFPGGVGTVSRFQMPRTADYSVFPCGKSLHDVGIFFQQIGGEAALVAGVPGIGVRHDPVDHFGSQSPHGFRIVPVGRLRHRGRFPLPHHLFQPQHNFSLDLIFQTLSRSSE